LQFWGFGAAGGVTAKFALDAAIPLSAGITLSGDPMALCGYSDAAPRSVAMSGGIVLYGYALHSSYVNWLIFRGPLPSQDLLGRNRGEIDGLLHQAQEQQAARS
jgi:hypothetical protein